MDALIPADDRAVSLAIAPRRDDSFEALYAAIRRDRRPLPAHDLDGVNYRRWAVAVCGAEAEHCDKDFWAVVHRHDAGLLFDRFQNDCPALYRYEHERAALSACNWMLHLQTHEGYARRPHGAPLREMEPGDAWGQRDWWISTRRKLWTGFLHEVRWYVRARKAFDTAAMKEAA